MRKTDILIRTETPADYFAAENLTREAFWNRYRPGCMEHFVLHCLRESPAFVPELSLLLEKQGRLIGQVVYARAAIEADDGRRVPILTFGPLSIAPDFQGQGYGRLLLDASMEKAAALGAGALAITGDIGFYGHSGFVPGKDIGIRYADDPGADYFLVKELRPGYLSGVQGSYRDIEEYFVCLTRPEEFAAFEAQFPAKEKLTLPGQLG